MVFVAAQRHRASDYHRDQTHESCSSARGQEVSELAVWDSFYVIVGSAAGAVGLRLVVMTLIAARPPLRPKPKK